MKPIGEIRQQRLQQLVEQTGLSYADINAKLGRNRRDATLNQVAKAAKNTSTGKPRRMGDAQARLLEATFTLPNGWFDSDPEEFPDIIGMKPTGGYVLKSLPKSWFTPARAHEDAVPYNADPFWPFQQVSRQAITKLDNDNKARLERVILAFLGEGTVSEDWRTTAFGLAAKLDQGQPRENFTLFVRALETELSKRHGARLEETPHAERRSQ